MPFETIEIPAEINQIRHSPDAQSLIDLANDRIESYMLANDSVTENFVPCDFHLVDQAFTWIRENHLLSGNCFCEFGSGFGVATLLASLHGMDAFGIEIESYLVDQAAQLASELSLSSEFFCGSFIPRDIVDYHKLEREAERVVTEADDVYDEMGYQLEDFDLCFAFPWPGDDEFFEAVFHSGAATGALLLTYQGRNGMRLVRKTSIY